MDNLVESDNISYNRLFRKAHIDELMRYLTRQLPPRFQGLVASLTWCVYWVTHSLSLLGKSELGDTVEEDVINFMIDCSHEEGGYGGGPGQIGHLATTYAAVNALISLSNEKALNSIDRSGIIKFLHRMKQPDGSFSMHDGDGEIDSRASYCALSVLRCLNIHDPSLTENASEWLLECQTYEGGFASRPGCEAHGGYTFCCVASLCLLGQLHRADLDSLVRWLANKQMSNDGGFCGRSNKLVDSCYSFWQGAVFTLIHPLLKSQDPSPDQSSVHGEGSKTQSMTKKNENALYPDLFNSWLFDHNRLQDYVLNKCQSDDGLLTDKPGVAVDLHHTCYALSGLSLSQHQPDGSLFDIGDHSSNILSKTSPLFNLTPENLNFCFKHFEKERIDIVKTEDKTE